MVRREVETGEADAASVIRKAVDIYRKFMDYQDEESEAQWCQALLCPICKRKVVPSDREARPRGG